jgi:rhodanese-related sulfurtransferase
MKEHFKNLGFEIGGILHLTGRQAIQCLEDDAVLIDVREDFEVAIKDFGVNEIIRCPFKEFEHNMPGLPKDRPLVVADCVSISSKKAVLKLLDAGYSMVANLAGGIADWEKDGLPMKSDVECMSGQCPCMIKSRNAQ